jgi:hypothetical protein
MSHLMIRDLEESKELDTHAMQAVRGGEGEMDLGAANAALVALEANGGIAGIATAVISQVGINNNFDVNVSPVTTVVVGGIS